MHPHQIYINGLRNDSWKDVRWLNSVFGTVVDEVSDLPWHVVKREDGIYYNDPDGGYKPVLGIADTSLPILLPEEYLDLPEKAWPELLEGGVVHTTVGNAFFMRLTNYALGEEVRIPYLHGKINAGQVENMLVSMVRDPDEYKEGSTDTIRAENLPRAIDAYYACTSYAHLCVPSMPTKLMMVPPGILKRKKELLEEYKDDLDNPSTIAKITSELNKLIDDFLENDPEVKGYSPSRVKMVRVSYMKRVGMIGGSSAFRNDGKMYLIKSSLAEGIDFRDFPAIQNDAREGSFLRGVETALGGEWTKFIYRILQNTLIESEFCGTTKTKQVTLLPESSKSYEGLYTKTSKGPMLMDSAFIKTNIGNTIDVYTQKYCKSAAPNYCAICAGKAMAERPESTAQDTAGVGDLFMGLSMSAMHGKELVTVRMRWKEHMI